MAENLPVIEVSFNPHGASEEWPHFLATAKDPKGDYLYELGEDGWRLALFFGNNGQIKFDSGEAHSDVEDALWRGSACLTGTPDIEAVTVPIIPGGALPSPTQEGR